MSVPVMELSGAAAYLPLDPELPATRFDVSVWELFLPADRWRPPAPAPAGSVGRSSCVGARHRRARREGAALRALDARPIPRWLRFARPFLRAPRLLQR
jgi:hypothetical protein